ncbi:MAG: hypothetical protein ACXQTM_00025 [Methanosarcinales archaeon]
MKSLEKSLVILVIPLLVLAIVLSGCLETPVAAPPAIDSRVLEENGWVQVGDVVRDSKSFEIGGREIRINTARITYADRELEEYLMDQIGVYRRPPQNLTAHILAMRIVLPSGIPLPSQLVLEMAGSQVEEMAGAMGLRDFHQVNMTTIEVRDGKSAEAKIYAGEMPISEKTTIPVKGVLTTWSASGSTIIASAIYPGGDFVLEREDEKVIIEIDGDAEYEEIVELLQQME